jgi:hypothetical protein
VDGDVIGYIRETAYGCNQWEVFSVEGARCAETTSGPADAARLIHDIHKAVMA